MRLRRLLTIAIVCLLPSVGSRSIAACDGCSDAYDSYEWAQPSYNSAVDEYNTLTGMMDYFGPDNVNYNAWMQQADVDLATIYTMGGIMSDASRYMRLNHCPQVY